jgi:hypothetical protein
MRAPPGRAPEITDAAKAWWLVSLTTSQHAPGGQSVLHQQFPESNRDKRHDNVSKNDEADGL